MSPIRRPDLAELETLVLAADDGSVAAAAAALQISRAAASKRLRTLEALVGAPLLERTPRGVIPTALGRETIAAARDVIAASNSMVATISDLKDADRSGRPSLARFLPDPTRLEPRAPTIRESLVDTQRLLSDIIHSSPVPMTISEQPYDGMVVDANAAYANLTGIPIAEMVGRTFRSLGVVANPDELKHLRKLVEEGGAATDTPAVLRRRDGKLRIVLVSSWHSAIGRRPLIFSTYQDVTERHRAEAEAGALRRVATLARDYVSLVQDGGAFISLNPSGRSLIGIPADADVTTISALDTMHPSMPADRIDEIRTRMGTDDTWTGRFILRHMVTGEAIPTNATLFFRRTMAVGLPLVAMVARPLLAPA